MKGLDYFSITFVLDFLDLSTTRVFLMDLSTLSLRDVNLLTSFCFLLSTRICRSLNLRTGQLLARLGIAYSNKNAPENRS